MFEVEFQLSGRTMSFLKLIGKSFAIYWTQLIFLFSPYIFNYEFSSSSEVEYWQSKSGLFTVHQVHLSKLSMHSISFDMGATGAMSEKLMLT